MHCGLKSALRTWLSFQRARIQPGLNQRQLNRRKDRIKILFWEEGGYWLCARRLEAGTFRWPQKEGVCASYRREELLLLLGGIDLKQTQKRKWYRREVEKR